MHVVRWGVLGCAHIADSAVLPAIRASGNGRLQAVASRDQAKAADFAGKHGAETAHGSYEALLTDPQIDAVYIPLPNALHAEWAMRAAAAGKAVLVEKPFAGNADEVQRVFAACARHGVVAGEALSYRFHPLHHRVAELIRRGAIGRLELLRSTFTVSIPPTGFRWEAGGGVLADLGCYSAGISRWLTGAEPVAIVARARYEQGVEATMSGLLGFPGGAQAIFMVSQAAQFDCSYEAIGATGRLRVDRGGTAAWPGEAFRIHLWDAAGERDETIPACNTYIAMVEAFASALRGGPPYPVNAAESLANQRVVDALAADAAAHRFC